MIGRLHGTLLEKNAPQLLIDVQGVGYEVDAPMSTFYNLPEQGASVTLHTHLVVREDSQTLYGFATEAERRLFRSLIKISGVGARLALTILSGVSPNEFVQLVQMQDSGSLTKLPGVGKKTAERLIVEMRDKIEDLNIVPMVAASSDAAVQQDLPEDPVREAVSALIALGYKPPEAARMVRDLPDKASLSSQDLIRQALQSVTQ